jgi:hypothetical protein
MEMLSDLRAFRGGTWLNIREIMAGPVKPPGKHRI